MKKIQDSGELFFFLSTAVFLVVAVTGIFAFLSRTLTMESLAFIRLLSILAIILLITGRLLEMQQKGGGVRHDGLAMIFSRSVTFFSGIVSIGSLGLVGILISWTWLTGGMVDSSAYAMGFFVLPSAITLLACLERSNRVSVSRGVHAQSHVRVDTTLVLLSIVLVLFFMLVGTLLAQGPVPV